MKCTLKVKETDKDCQKKELRFESDEIKEGSKSKLDELVVMDTMVYVLIQKKEYIFMKSQDSNEPNQEKEYDYAYSLVSPAKEGPMVLLLTAKKETNLYSISAFEIQGDEEDDENATAVVSEEA